MKFLQLAADKTKLRNNLIKIRKDTTLIGVLLEATSEDKTTAKFAYDKLLRTISKSDPELVYPYFDSFVKNLDSENSFIKWGAIITIANLTGVDKLGKFRKIHKKFFRPITGPEMITASNLVKSATIISALVPEYTDKLVSEIFKTRNADYIHKDKTSKKCKEIVLSQAVTSLSNIVNNSSRKEEVLEFVDEIKAPKNSSLQKKITKLKKRYS